MLICLMAIKWKINCNGVHEFFIKLQNLWKIIQNANKRERKIKNRSSFMENYSNTKDFILQLLYKIDNSI